MGKLYDSKAMKKLQVMGQKLGSNPVFSSISKAMMGLMAIILIGAVFQIVASVATLLDLTTTESAFYKFCMIPYDASVGMLGVYAAFTVAYNYAKTLGVKQVQAGISSLVLFLIVSAPVQKMVLADGVTELTYMDTSSLGSVGLFVAFLIGFLSVRVTYLCEKRNFGVNLPEVVPPFLRDSFAALVPLVINVLIWHGLNTLVTNTLSITLPIAINYIFSIPLSVLNSVPGMIIIILIATLLWTFGMHGTMIAVIAIMPVMMQDIAANAAAVAAGNEPQFYASMLFMTAACAGGTGNTLGLVIHGSRSKSEQIKSISRVSLIPSLFNINEPVIFGMPIMLNPILAIPFMLVPAITAILVWIGYSIGFFVPPHIFMFSVMPIGFMEFFSSLAWQNIFIPVIGIVVGLIVYYPFLKVYEKQLLENEAKTNVE